MLISVDWVKEFVTLPEMNPKELGDKFTMSTAEVEEVKVVGDHLEKIVLFRIKGPLVISKNKSFFDLMI